MVEKHQQNRGTSKKKDGVNRRDFVKATGTVAGSSIVGVGIAGADEETTEYVGRVSFVEVFLSHEGAPDYPVMSSTGFLNYRWDDNDLVVSRFAPPPAREIFMRGNVVLKGIEYKQNGETLFQNMRSDQLILSTGPDGNPA